MVFIIQQVCIVIMCLFLIPIPNPHRSSRSWAMTQKKKTPNKTEKQPQKVAQPQIIALSLLIHAKVRAVWPPPPTRRTLQTQSSTQRDHIHPLRLRLLWSYLLKRPEKKKKKNQRFVFSRLKPPYLEGLFVEAPLHSCCCHARRRTTEGLIKPDYMGSLGFTHRSRSGTPHRAI